MMKRMRGIIAIGVGAVCFFAGCERPAPPKDTTPPEITVTVSRARGRNVFRSIDGPLEPGNDCIIIEGQPTQLILIAGDAGGIESVSLRAFPATIVPESVDITPRPPEGTYSITSVSGGDTLLITLTPPSPTTVRTGVSAVLEVYGPPPFAIIASVRDRAGQLTELPQFDLRRSREGITCRGSE